MNLEERLADYKQAEAIRPQCEKTARTIQMSKEAFYASEQEGLLSYPEFLWAQCRLVQKRWWAMQLALLAGLWLALYYMGESVYTQRCMGVAAPLFVILTIPELWKNQTCRCMEIETAAYYSIRQIYAARMALFGIVDVFLITLFFTAASAALQYAFGEFLIQFLFPMVVTACLCFGTLSGRYRFHEAAAAALCILWNGVWVLIILNERIYAAITFPLWAGLFLLALACLLVLIGRAWKLCNRYYEVNANGIEI